MYEIVTGFHLSDLTIKSYKMTLTEELLPSDLTLDLMLPRQHFFYQTCSLDE